MFPRTLILSVPLALSLLSGPVFAGGYGYTTPTLTWPKPAAPVTRLCLPTAPLGDLPAISCAPAR